MTVLLGSISVLAIIFIIPVLVYGLFSAILGLKEPDKKLSFLAGVLIQKFGITVGFVALFWMGKEYFADRWLMYGLVWFAMYALTEVGQSIMSDYTRKEASAGIISELIYFPASALVLAHIIG